MKIKFLLTLILTVMLLAVHVEAAWQPEIRIGILSGVESVNLQMSMPSVIVDAADNTKILRKVEAGENFSIDFATLKVEAVEIRGDGIPLTGLQITINGKKYFGGARINKTGGALTVINLVPAEEYLRGVVPNEMPISFEPEALKAQAVAARTFMLKNRGRHSAEGYDLCATNHCQFYGGVEDVASTDSAISETWGLVVVLKDALVDANFHTDSGGMTENVADVWGTSAPHLAAVKELETKTQPWKVELPAKDFAARISSSLGDLNEIKLSALEIGKAEYDRSKSGRVKFAVIVGSAKTIQISGNDLRTKFSLPSTLFDMKLQNGTVTFEGYGRGHGVGMSQYGAQSYAKAGWDYKKILAHYYTGTDLKKLY